MLGLPSSISFVRPLPRCPSSDLGRGEVRCFRRRRSSFVVRPSRNGRPQKPLPLTSVISTSEAAVAAEAAPPPPWLKPIHHPTDKLRGEEEEEEDASNDLNEAADDKHRRRPRNFSHCPCPSPLPLLLLFCPVISYGSSSFGRGGEEDEMWHAKRHTTALLYCLSSFVRRWKKRGREGGIVSGDFALGVDIPTPLHFLLLLTCEERSPFSLARRGEKKNCFRFGLRQLVVTLLKSRGGGGGFFA